MKFGLNNVNKLGTSGYPSVAKKKTRSKSIFLSNSINSVVFRRKSSGDECENSRCSDQTTLNELSLRTRTGIGVKSQVSWERTASLNYPSTKDFSYFLLFEEFAGYKLHATSSVEYDSGMFRRSDFDIRVKRGKEDISLFGVSFSEKEILC